MNLNDEKCIMIIDEEMPLGIIANTAAILGITLGRKAPDIVGCDVTDYEGYKHSGIIQFPVPILKGNRETINLLRRKLFSAEFSDLTVVDFTDLAQGCKTYTEFMEQMDLCPENKLSYIGIAVCGGKKKINKLTGNLPLLR